MAVLVNKEAKQAFVTAMERRYGAKLRRFLSFRLRHASADVPDLFQEIFVRLLRIKDQETIRNPQAYLYTVASHVLHQHARLQSTTLGSDKTDIERPPPADLQSDPAMEVETEQAFEELGRSLQKLSPNAYATLILHRCEGLTLQQIGDRLGVSRAQVKKYLARALLHVRQGLSEMDQSKT